MDTCYFKVRPCMLSSSPRTISFEGLTSPSPCGILEGPSSCSGCWQGFGALCGSIISPIYLLGVILSSNPNQSLLPPMILGPCRGPHWCEDSWRRIIPALVLGKAVEPFPLPAPSPEPSSSPGPGQSPQVPFHPLRPLVAFWEIFLLCR